MRHCEVRSDEAIYKPLNQASLYQSALTAFQAGDHHLAVDKNRAWLGMVETLAQIDPEFHMLVTIRELTQLYGSIESQHQRTQLLDSGDGTAGMSRYGRASTYFNGDGLVARSLTAIQSAIEDLPEDIKERIMYVEYERLAEAPVEVMTEIHERVGVNPSGFDPGNLQTRPSETDSHYRYKFPHSRRNSIAPPSRTGSPNGSAPADGPV